MDNKNVSFNNIDEDVRLKEAFDEFFEQDFFCCKEINDKEYPSLSIPKVKMSTFDIPETYENEEESIKFKDKISKRRKKKFFSFEKKSAVAILIFIFVISLGYTLLTDKLVINGTASLNEIMDINYTCNIIHEGELKSTASGNCDIYKNEIKTTSTLYKPTDVVNYMIVITNNGNFPVTLTNVLSSNNKIKNFSSSGDEAYINDDGFLSGQYTIYHNQKEYIGDKYISNQNIILNPSEMIIVIINHKWLSLDNQPKLENDSVISYNILMTFKQG